MHTLKLAIVVSTVLTSAACDGVNSDADARIASLGLDAIVTRVLGLGFDGFNTASSANIDAQSADGDVSGSVAVNGQVDQGASANKGMRLTVALDDYADATINDPETDGDDKLDLRYTTADGADLAVGISLKGIPDGTLDGTMAGDVRLAGDLEADVTVSLSFAGALEADGDGTARVIGSTAVTGTVDSGDSTFDVDFDI